MANQSPDRRQILELLAKIAAVGQFPGFSRWALAAEHAHGGGPIQPRPAHYKPQFFTPAEYRTVDRLTDLIIPKDSSPGAHEAGVAEFIDFMAAHDDHIQFPFRTGVSWLNAFAFENHGREFTAVTPEQQQALLTGLAFQSKYKPEQVQGQEFFKLIREYTVMGYYTSRAGLEELDDPGLKFYSASPECPHKDDPEHLHLTSVNGPVKN